MNLSLHLGYSCLRNLSPIEPPMNGGDNTYDVNFLTLTNANYNLTIYLASEASTSRTISWYVYGFLK